MTSRASAEVTKVSEVADNTFLLEFHSPEIAKVAAPGQFVNIKVDRSFNPLLRRPMSICDVEGERVRVLFNVVGRGTSILARRIPNEKLDILGPLGIGFSLSNSFDTAIIVGGGLGAAPFPFLTRALQRAKKKVYTFIGARSAKQLTVGGLENTCIATDDGSEGYHGTVIDLLRQNLPDFPRQRPFIFGCGPSPMLRALQRTANEFRIRGEVSVETPMACGLGLCQGCPVEMVDGERKYGLACRNGPVFDLSKIVI
jgi:dihydroorotate dehydrogenase electron transfer subunit